MVRRLRQLDWEAVVGVVAAGAALLLHFLHIVESDLLLALALVLMALLLVRDLRLEDETEELANKVERTEQTVDEVRRNIEVPGVELLGPSNLVQHATRFATQARGEVTYFNLHVRMLESQDLFEALVGTLCENPEVPRVRFVLDRGQRDRWEEMVAPTLSTTDLVETAVEPIWCDIEEPVAFAMAEETNGDALGLMTFWGPPFMPAKPGRDVPRYLFRLGKDAELVPRLRELERGYRVDEHGAQAR